MIKEKVAEGLMIENLTTPKFSLRPKMHSKGNPSRPVVSSVNCHTSNVTKCVDYHLQPNAGETPSYVKESGGYSPVNWLSQTKRNLAIEI